MARVLITGGTGLIGAHLCRRLPEKGYEIAILSRAGADTGQIPTYIWDINKFEIDKEAIAAADYIIHLSGTNIGEKRWTRKRKQQIRDSRIRSAQLIYDEIRKQKKNLKAFISASAIGYYGTITTERIFIETDPPGDDFLGQTCSKWEHIADQFLDLGIRTVKIRTGVVLSDRGGALSKIAMPIKKGFGSAIGSGKQYLPWIHIDDLCGIYIKAIEDAQMVGAFNAVAPEHLTNKEFTQRLAYIMKKTLWLPNIPAFVMKSIFGKMSEILLQGSRVSSEKIQSAGYKFLFPSLESSLKQLIC
jgi:uncharacterized protein (TIGR01777 family)